ncbi:PREDICTED: uncharacterized protein LOC109352991 [Lupinus angustifolius]|nr:PREDICTED: uncharacterized protein LOC109352991 [Lupinus angustifolius]
MFNKSSKKIILNFEPFHTIPNSTKFLFFIKEASGIVEKDQLSLKLMVHKETNKVLFAEVGKDFVDVLISFLTLPLGTIDRLVAKQSDMGPIRIASVSSLYESVEELYDDYMLTDSCMVMLLHPKNPMEDYCRSLKLNVDDTDPTNYYVCNNLLQCQNGGSVMCSTFKSKKCSCGKLLGNQIFLKGYDSFEGFVKENSCFLVTDDLCILPMSLDTMVSIIKKMGIEDISTLKEIEVGVTKNKLIDLLKCSLVSKTPLTDVFLHKKPCLQKSDGNIVYLSSDFIHEQCTSVDVKIMYQKSDGKILCAQGNDFANFLLSFLTFPLGVVVRLLQGNSSMGSIDGLYKSVADLNEDLFNTKEVKVKLVDLGLPPQFKLSNQVLPISEVRAPIYHCVTKSSNPKLSDFFLTEDPIIVDPSKKCMDVIMVDPISVNESSKVFLRGPTVFAATDDLLVSPISFIPLLSLSNNSNTNLGDIDVKLVNIGLYEGLSILKASLTSSSALTNGLAHLVIVF